MEVRHDTTPTVEEGIGGVSTVVIDVELVFTIANLIGEVATEDRELLGIVELRLLEEYTLGWVLEVAGHEMAVVFEPVEIVGRDVEGWG
jgi:hypothetical protein